MVENGRYILGENNKRKYLMEIWFSEFKDTSKEEISLDKTILKYTRCHIGFTSIHPFFDGNGRLARLISNIFMLKNGYLPMIVSNENRDVYIKLLSTYNLKSTPLDKNSKKIIEENEEFNALYEFFKSEYQNSQILLDEIKG